MHFQRLFAVLLGVTLVTGCSIHHPCAEGGDVSWTPKISGDKRCTQKKNSDGSMVNDGPFRQSYYKTNTIALEGQFTDGKKQGIWLYYGEDGGLKVAKFFEKGVERNPPPEVQKQIDLMIQQKTGMK